VARALFVVSLSAASGDSLFLLIFFIFHLHPSSFILHFVVLRLLTQHSAAALRVVIDVCDV
jgi:hypothetical protein